MARVIHKLSGGDLRSIGRANEVVVEVLKENPNIVKDYEKNPRALEALIGKCMKKTHGQIDPNIARKMLLKLIKNSEL